jgi:hypothetical protein
MLTNVIQGFGLGRIFCFVFPVLSEPKQGNVLSSFLLKCVLEYVIRKVHENKETLKLNGTHQPQIYADDNLLGENMNVITNTTEVLLDTNKIELEVNALKTMHISPP